MAADAGGPAGAVERVLLLLWGDVIEDYLGPIGLDVESFLGQVVSGWMFGYIAGLEEEGVETVLVLVSARATAPRRTVHRPTGTTVWLLPPSRAFRLCDRIVGLAAGGGLVRRVARASAREVRAYAATPAVRVSRIVRQEGIGGVICQEYESPRFDVCVVLGRMLRIPVFGTFQGGTRRHHRLERLLRPWAVRAAAALVIGAGVEVDRVSRRYRLDRSRIAQIGNPVAVPATDLVELRRRGRAEIGAGPDTVVVSWHGRVELERKGLDVLLAAWRQVVQQVDADVRLALMGSGGDDARLRDLLASFPERVTWIDEYVTDRARIDRFLAGADVYAFPSPHEGFPVAPLEAMMAGTPVVATAAPGIEDIFPGGEASGGLVVPVGDVERFAAGLVHLVDDADARARQGCAARRRAIEGFSAAAVGRQLHDLLQRRSSVPAPADHGGAR